MGNDQVCVDEFDNGNIDQQEQKKRLKTETVNHKTKKEETNMEEGLLQHVEMLALQRENIHPYAYKVLNFWYPPTFNECMELWFGKSTQIDETIKNEFTDILTNALKHHKYDSWIYSSPFECLALIILLDQFPRNIYRNSAEMYSADKQCQAILSTAMWKCYHLELLPIHSVSFCLVLTHSENTILQELCIRVWAQIRKYMPPNYASDLQLFDAIFQKHFDVVEKFGRFPHRNKILNRKSTNEEEIFLSNDEFRFDLPLKPTEDGFGFKETKSYVKRFDNSDDEKDNDIEVTPRPLSITHSSMNTLDP
eukprot:452632_1